MNIDQINALGGGAMAFLFTLAVLALIGWMVGLWGDD